MNAARSSGVHPPIWRAEDVRRGGLTEAGVNALAIVPAKFVMAFFTRMRPTRILRQAGGNQPASVSLLNLPRRRLVGPRAHRDLASWRHHHLDRRRRTEHHLVARAAARLLLEAALGGGRASVQASKRRAPA